MHTSCARCTTELGSDTEPPSVVHDAANMEHTRDVCRCPRPISPTSTRYSRYTRAHPNPPPSVRSFEMDWIPELACQCVAFLADGVPMPTSGELTADGESVCDNPCPNPTLNCDYHCETDAFLTCDA